MDTLFKNMQEIIDFATVDISGNFLTIKPYLFEAHKYVLKGLDKATFDNLISYYNDDDAETDESLDNLLPYVQRILANFAYAIGVKRLGVFVGENGAMEFANTNLTPLSTERLDQVKTEFYNSGFNSIEMLILFIQENSNIYDDSYSYLFDNSFFVSTASEMNSIIYTDVQHRDFFEMKPDLFLIEADIEGIITTEVSNAIKEAIKDEIITDSQTAMLNLIKPAECCLAYGHKFKSEDHILKGKNYLEKLRIYYATLTETEIDRWDNEDKTIYVFK